MDTSILTVSMCMGQSTRMNKVKDAFTLCILETPGRVLDKKQCANPEGGQGVRTPHEESQKYRFY